MRSIEVSGKSIEEAKQLASEELGVPVEDIEFEIIDEPGKGFLGLAHSPAKVKATTAVGEPEKVEEPEAVEEAEAAPPAEEPEEAFQAEGTPDQVADEMIALLRQIFGAMDVDAAASVKHANDEEIAIDITGADVAILIGKQGQTLDALQYLVGIAANRKHQTKLRVVLDAEGYRKRHEDMIIARAMDYVRHVKETGEEAVFDPMSARDRRTVHLALKDDPEVYTYSEGEGAERHLVISPRKAEQTAGKASEE